MNSLFQFNGIIFAQPAADLFCVVLAALMFAIIKKNLKKDPDFNMEVQKNNLIAKSAKIYYHNKCNSRLLV